MFLLGFYSLILFKAEQFQLFSPFDLGIMLKERKQFKDLDKKGTIVVEGWGGGGYEQNLTYGPITFQIC